MASILTDPPGASLLVSPPPAPAQYQQLSPQPQPHHYHHHHHTLVALFPSPRAPPTGLLKHGSSPRAAFRLRTSRRPADTDTHTATAITTIATTASAAASVSDITSAETTAASEQH